MTSRLSSDVTRIRKNKKKKKRLPTIRGVTDLVGNEVKDTLPPEKPPRTVGGPSVVPYRTVLDGILYVLRTECQSVEDTRYQESTAPVLPVTKGSRSGSDQEEYFRSCGSGY